VNSYKFSLRHILEDLILQNRSESIEPRISTVVIPALKMQYQTVLGILLM